MSGRNKGGRRIMQRGVPGGLRVGAGGHQVREPVAEDLAGQGQAGGGGADGGSTGEGCVGSDQCLGNGERNGVGHDQPPSRDAHDATPAPSDVSPLLVTRDIAAALGRGELLVVLELHGRRTVAGTCPDSLAALQGIRSRLPGEPTPIRLPAPIWNVDEPAPAPTRYFPAVCFRIEDDGG